ncbi:SMC-Scp complex subunit ScpB [Clostridium fallax]|uniref:Segregation and condensation protein B n=1 Tax=Clostridium fallax TaxID=1533 RepID=A0A1M4Y003_9CLOT|nr:SMC-Scp complex subunit ScpB [Clostridium fallax]SHE98812.1 condensin subunit ScpB [Clostridium fallax]SQB06494.1 segregation and condensation protein B [Clostridium fallax]
MDSINYSQFEFEEASNKNRIISIIESLLFVSGEPLPLKEISKILEINENKALEILKDLSDRYEKEDRGIKLISINNNYQLITKPENSNYIHKLLKKNTRQSLSQASLESLAIIAYRQPITRIDIDEIRGVKSESAIQRLVERNLIKEVGRLDVPGRPIQYGTTDEFLRQFGLTDLKDLPVMDEFKEEEEEVAITEEE